VSRPLRASFLQRVGYEAACALQDRARAAVLAGDLDAETLFLVEHEPVITLGRRAAPGDVLARGEVLGQRGVQIARSTRGGAASYHGPGQLVAYPVVRITRGVVRHVEALAEAAIELAASVGVAARFRRDRPGVWVEDRKLAAIGVHVHRGVAIHGIALNVSTDLEGFDLIVPCGQRGVRATSLTEEVGRVGSTRSIGTVADLAAPLGKALGRALGREIRFAPEHSGVAISTDARRIAPE
jgi:lipoate-protein ligase B